MANRYVWNSPMTGHTAEAAKLTRLTQSGACCQFASANVGSYHFVKSISLGAEMADIADPCLPGRHYHHTKSLALAASNGTYFSRESPLGDWEVKLLRS